MISQEAAAAGTLRGTSAQVLWRWLAAIPAMALGVVIAFGCGGETATPPVDQAPPLDTLRVEAPGFPAMPVPADNPTTVQGVALGRRLFYDPILSGDSTQACASCHDQRFAFSDRGRALSSGIDGLAGTRNASALVNPGWNLANFWDGRRGTLEQQALEPVPNPIEMHLPWDEAERRLARHPLYPDLFRAAFGTRTVTRDRAVRAIAQFERTLVSSQSRYDRFLRTGRGLSASERRGYVLFFTERAECFHCHVDRTFTDHTYQNNGLDSVFTDTGRFAVTGDRADLGLFKVPTLRNLGFTAPYMHDGRFATLAEVIDHYDRGGHGTTNVNPFILNLRRNFTEGRGLTPADKQDLLAFLATLDDSSFVADPDLASPFGGEGR